MTLRRSAFAGVAALAATVMLAAPAAAADIRVLTAGAPKPLVTALGPGFERETGHRLVVDGDTAGGLVKRVLAGEPFDVLVVTRAGIEQLQQAGKLSGPSVPLARVGIGAAVLLGTAAPDISTVPGFRQALLTARAVAYIDPAAGGSSGIYLARLFERMGIAAEIGRKAVLVHGGLVTDQLSAGKADLALQQTSELMGAPGVTVLGPIPDELQNYTIYVVDPANRPQPA